MGKMFNLIKEGLEDAIAYEKGKVNLRTKEIDIPKPPKEYRASDVKKIRKNLCFSQGLLAAYMNVSVKTVQSWESGLRHPTSSALRLLEMMESESNRNKLFKSL